MEKVFYNKLIRDKIPDKILKKGSKLKTRKLNTKEFEIALRKILEEEAGGVMSAKNKSELTKELADVRTIIKELQRTNKISTTQLQVAERIENKLKGKFKKHLFLIWSSKDDYKTNEKRYKK